MVGMWIANLEAQTVKNKFFEAFNEPDAETNSSGEWALHGRTIYAWTTAIPSGPLKEGG